MEADGICWAVDQSAFCSSAIDLVKPNDTSVTVGEAGSEGNSTYIQNVLIVTDRNQNIELLSCDIVGLSLHLISTLRLLGP